MRDDDPRDCGPMPERLRRAPLDRRPVCAVCKKSEPPPNRAAIAGLDVWLHRGCEDEFSGRLDRGGGPDVPQPTLAEPSAQTNGGAVEKPPDAVADVPDPAEKAPPAADVIDEAEKVRQGADQPVSTPDPVPRQPVLVMQDSKEDAGLPPQVVEKQPDAVPEKAPSAPPAMTYDEQIAAIMKQPMLPGDRQRALKLVRNQKAVQRFDAALKQRLQ